MIKRRRLYYVSDLHLEMRSDKWGRKALIVPESKDERNFLALCGDIGSPFHPNYRDLLAQHSALFERIFVITGNHEYYVSNSKQHTMADVNAKLQQVVSEFPNVDFLNVSCVEIDETKIIGCT